MARVFSQFRALPPQAAARRLFAGLSPGQAALAGRTLQFSHWYHRHGRLVKSLVALSAPAAWLAEWVERIRFRPGPVNSFLYRWYRVAIRWAMFEGLLQFRAEGPQPLHLPEAAEVRKKAA